MALVAILLCLNFYSCELTDEPTLPGEVEDLQDEEFYGTYAEGYGISIYIKNKTYCIVSLLHPGSDDLLDIEMSEFQYNTDTYTFTFSYNGKSMVGQLRAGDDMVYMDLTDDTGTYTLKYNMDDVDIANVGSSFSWNYLGSGWRVIDRNENVKKELHPMGEIVYLKFYELNSENAYPIKIVKYSSEDVLDPETNSYSSFILRRIGEGNHYFTCELDGRTVKVVSSAGRVQVYNRFK